MIKQKENTSFGCPNKQITVENQNRYKGYEQTEEQKEKLTSNKFLWGGIVLEVQKKI